jgi:3-hydroxybutyryl-CoA dehydrogenase
MAYMLPDDVDRRPVAIVGAGTLGRRIAAVYAGGGSDVRIFDMSAEQRSAAEDYVDQHIAETQKTLGLQPERAGHVEAADDLQQAVSGAWMVIEVVPERVELKTEVFGDLDRLAEPDAILATNSSSLPSSQMIGKVQHPERVLNTHYQQPPELNSVELMSCGQTDDGVIDALMAKIPEYGLAPFRVRRESDGFIFNRIWASIKRECLMVVEEGVATPEDVDEMWRTSRARASRRFGSWTASGSTSCSPSRSTTPRFAPACPRGRARSCATTSTRAGSVSRAAAGSTTSQGECCSETRR